MGKKKSAAKPASKPAMPAMLAGAIFGLFVIASVVWLLRAGQHQSVFTAAPAASARDAAASTSPSFAGVSFASQGHAHLGETEPDDFIYNSNPPTSGPHKEIFSDQFVNPAPLPKYVQAHLLEHGNVLMQYNCVCPDIAASLSAIAYVYDSKLIAPNELQPTPEEVQAGEEQGKAVLVAPYPGMKSKIALTAWTRLATLDSVDKAKIESFIGLYLANQANASQ